MLLNCNYVLYDKYDAVITQKSRVACYAELFNTTTTNQLAFWNRFSTMHVFIDRKPSSQHHDYCTFTAEQIIEFTKLFNDIGFPMVVDLDRGFGEERIGATFVLKKKDYIGYNHLKMALFFLRLFHEHLLPGVLQKYQKLKAEAKDIEDSFFLFWLSCTTSEGYWSGHGVPLFSLTQKKGSSYYFVKNNIPSKDLMIKYFESTLNNISTNTISDFRRFLKKSIESTEVKVIDVKNNNFTKEQIEQIKEFYEQK